MAGEAHQVVLLVDIRLLELEDHPVPLPELLLQPTDGLRLLLDLAVAVDTGVFLCV